MHAAEGCGNIEAAQLFFIDVTILSFPKRRLEFLIDSGSSVSIIPRTCASDNLKDYYPSLYTANHSPIRVFGQRCIVDFSIFRRVFRWNFVVADIARPILGMDFLSAHNLISLSTAAPVLDRW